MSFITTPITELFGIKHPIILAGMNVAAGPELAAAVTNAGGLGVIGGVGYTPKFLRQQIKALKKDLKDPNAPFGVDLLLPQVGGNARKTNHDYTHGQLPELIDVIVEEKTRLFVSAVGVPPKQVIDKLHQAGILVMNMIGHPKHVKKALEVGVDLICAQAAKEAVTPVTSPRYTSPLTGQPIWVVGAGAVYDGRGLAANLIYGAQAVWVGTRFVASEEAGATKAHKESILSADHGDAVRTLIYTGRPLRVRRTPYVDDWETNRQAEIKELTAKGIIPNQNEVEKHPEMSVKAVTFMMGNVSALIGDILPAKTIVDNMVNDAARVSVRAKL
ncbi:2-nitropropane dioxygenase [Lactifluus volemus]|nr:2-nitropropane dioxygenase [Lactifluus volemus]